ncbi:trypsin-like peptidase domain-containing protein [Candidatus Sumerlaeota bacterium]|nr:trypsin-like peptidase domain-containing protein [Candidatus Sumerlaeota bacterium]
MRHSLAGALIMGLLVTSPVGQITSKQGDALSALEQRMVEVAARVRPAVVMIQASLLTEETTMDVLREHFAEAGLDDLIREEYSTLHEHWLSQPWLIPREESLGSGVIVDARGLILTNSHVVEDYNSFFITLLDGSIRPARVIGLDPHSDVALLEITHAEGEEFPTVPLGTSADLEVGQMVMAIGTPVEREFSHSVSTGIISAIGRAFELTDFDNLIQTDCAINPGNSGGPLLNLEGELIGINTALVTTTGSYMGLSFAIPIDQVIHVMEQLLTEGRVQRAFLGVHIQDLTPDLASALGIEATQGALISSVAADSPAASVDLQPYDAVISCNGEPVTSSNDLKHRISSSLVGSSVALGVERAGETHEVVVTLAELTEDLITNNGQRRTPPPSPPPLDPESFGIEVADYSPELCTLFGLDPKNPGTGVVVETTAPGSYAAILGLLPGIRVLEVNQVEVHSVDDYRAVLEDSGSDTVLLRVVNFWGRDQLLTLRRGQ